MLLFELLNLVDYNTIVKIIDTVEHLPKNELLFEGHAIEVFENIELKKYIEDFIPCSIKSAEGKLEILVY